MKHTAPNESDISRVIRSKAEAQASYDRMSKWYDVVAGSEKKYCDVGLQMLNAQSGEVVLEIGFGTGQALLTLARAVGASGYVYGIDLSAGMLKIAAARIDAAGLSDRVELQCSDAVQLPFPSNFFDAVFTSFALELFDTPEIPIVLEECHRVLARGGRLGVVALSRLGKHGVMVRLYEWAHRHFSVLIDCRPIFVQASLEAASFQPTEAKLLKMWGLPLEVIVAKKIL